MRPTDGGERELSGKRQPILRLHIAFMAYDFMVHNIAFLSFFF